MEKPLLDRSIEIGDLSTKSTNVMFQHLGLKNGPLIIDLPMKIMMQIAKNK